MQTEIDLFARSRPLGRKGIVREWAEELGIRHQGVLLTAIRGCDTVAKHDPIKLLARQLRGLLMYTFSDTPSSFIEYTNYRDAVDISKLKILMQKVVKDFDHHPSHYVLHLAHAAEIIGYRHPDLEVRSLWYWLYYSICHAMHMNPETAEQMDHRLGASEASFAARQ